MNKTMTLINKKSKWRDKKTKLLFKNNNNEFSTYLINPILIQEKNLRKGKIYHLLFSKIDKNEIIDVLEK